MRPDVVATTAPEATSASARWNAARNLVAVGGGVRHALTLPGYAAVRQRVAAGFYAPAAGSASTRNGRGAMYRVPSCTKIAYDTSDPT